MRDPRFPAHDGAPRNGAPRNWVGHPAATGILSGDDAAGAPVDLVAVQADDELLSALGARPGPLPGDPGPVFRGPDDGPDHGGLADDDRLVAMLAAWRAEIDADPIPELIDLDAAVAAVVSGMPRAATTVQRRRSGRLRHLAPLAAAAAIIVTTVTGVGLGSQDAVPGDTLWAIQKVVNPERAESVEAKVEVETRLQKVRAALESGDTATAAEELAAIRSQIPVVRGQEGQPQLLQEEQYLAAKLADTPPGVPADLTTPPASNPAARSTGTPAPPALPGGPVPDPSVTAPSASQDATDPVPSGPDVRSDPADRGSAPAAPLDPDAPLPDPPGPTPPEPDVTSAPAEPKPDRGPDRDRDPGPPAGPGSEGGPDPTVPADPAVPANPVEPSRPGAGDGGAADTTTASGSAGASVDTTATGPTS